MAESLVRLGSPPRVPGQGQVRSPFVPIRCFRREKPRLEGSPGEGQERSLPRVPGQEQVRSPLPPIRRSCQWDSRLEGKKPPGAVWQRRPHHRPPLRRASPPLPRSLGSSLAFPSLPVPPLPHRRRGRSVSRVILLCLDRSSRRLVLRTIILARHRTRRVLAGHIGDLGVG